MITNLNDFRKSVKENHMDFPNTSDVQQPTINTEPIDNTVKLRDALNNLLKQNDQYFIEMYNRGYKLHSGGASEPETDPGFLNGMVRESRSDIRYALSEFEEFYEQMMATEKFDIIVNDGDKLMSACAAYANGADLLDFVHLEKRMIKENQQYITIPNVTTTEQLKELIGQNIQKAMDIFTAQQKMPQLTVTVKGDYLNIISKIYEDEELGIFKSGVSKAQIQLFNSTKLIVSNGQSPKEIWGTLNLHYEVKEGGSNGVKYNFTEDGKDNQFFYDIIANKFFTRKDYFTKTEKRATGYNTKRSVKK